MSNMQSDTLLHLPSTQSHSHQSKWCGRDTRMNVIPNLSGWGRVLRSGKHPIFPFSSNWHKLVNSDAIMHIQNREDMGLTKLNALWNGHCEEIFTFLRAL